MVNMKDAFTQTEKFQREVQCQTDDDIVSYTWLNAQLPTIKTCAREINPPDSKLIKPVPARSCQKPGKKIRMRHQEVLTEINPEIQAWLKEKDEHHRDVQRILKEVDQDLGRIPRTPETIDLTSPKLKQQIGTIVKKKCQPISPSLSLANTYLETARKQWKMKPRFTKLGLPWSDALGLKCDYGIDWNNNEESPKKSLVFPKRAARREIERCKRRKVTSKENNYFCMNHELW